MARAIRFTDPLAIRVAGRGGAGSASRSVAGPIVCGGQPRPANDGGGYSEQHQTERRGERPPEVRRMATDRDRAGVRAVNLRVWEGKHGDGQLGSRTWLTAQPPPASTNVSFSS